MKTMTDGHHIFRVPDKQAEDLIKLGFWRYIPKRFWKAERKYDHTPTIQKVAEDLKRQGKLK